MIIGSGNFGFLFFFIVNDFFYTDAKKIFNRKSAKKITGHFNL